MPNNFEYSLVSYKTLSLTLLLLGGFIVEGQAFYVKDYANHFGPNEISKIDSVCQILSDEHGMSAFIYIYESGINADEFSKASRSIRKYLYLQVDLAAPDINLEFLNVDQSSRRYYTELFRASLEQPLANGESLRTGLLQALSHIIKRFEQQKLANDEAYRRVQEEKGLSQFTAVFLLLNVLFFLAFVIRFTIKSAKGGNAFENIEFYGLSRLNMWVSLALGALLIYLIFHLSGYFPSDERHLFLIGMAFTFYPLIAAVSAIGMYVMDALQLPHYDTDRAPLTIAQQRYLTDPSVSSEDLMELNFYELIIDGHIKLAVEREYESRRRSPQFIVARVERDIGSLAKDHQVFIHHLPDHPIILESFLKRVYKSFGRFKVYRKDYVVWGLFRRGLVGNWSWVFNRFSPTVTGEELTDQLKSKASKQRHLVEQTLAGSMPIADCLAGINKSILLDPSYDRIITDLFNRMIDEHELHLGNGHSMSIFFHPEFTFRDFNRRLHHAYAYRMRWEDVPDVTNWNWI